MAKEAKQRILAFIRRTNPVLAAVLNFFVWGLGYLYNRGRVLLGLSLCTFVVTLFTCATYIASTPTAEAYNSAVIAVVCAWVFVSFALAVDAYQDSKAIAEVEGG